MRIVDTTTEKRSPGERWLMDVDEKTVRDIFSDSTNLYVVTKDGTMIWDITSRQHVASLTGFSADLFDRRRGMLIAFEADVIIECKL